MRKRIALVNQRYGLEVNGGSELLCRQLAERLTEHYEVDVITTCAIDYERWENYYAEGREVINGVNVLRFKVEKQRNKKKFDACSARVLGNKNNTPEEEKKWIEEQGPFCTAAVEYIKNHHSEYGTVIFTTYLYYLSAMGMALNLDNALLLPTAHDEAPIYLNYYRKVFENARGLIYLTSEEKEIVEKMFDTAGKPSVITGSGVDAPSESELFDAKERYGLSDYILYAGRIDESKGCGMLFKYFTEYKKRNGGDLKLVLIGKSVMDIPKREDIVHLGFVSDEEKFSLMKDSRFLVLASEFESLSMVVLESMFYGRPVLLNGKCKVLRGHCTKSNAGLYFENYFEFEGAMNYLLGHPEQYAQMRENGKRYVSENYRWDVLIGRICDLIENYNVR